MKTIHEPATMGDLFHDVDSILETLLDEHVRFEGEPINYADLNCAEVRLSYDGDNFITEVIIEEAAPYECPNLVFHVADKLRELGWSTDDIDILTEW